MSHIYFCHSAQDREFVKEIAAGLGHAGCETWIDTVKLDSRPEINWIMACQEAMESSIGIVGILTLNALRLNRLQREWDWSLTHNHPIFFVSLLAQDDERFIPFRFRDIHLSRYETLQQTISSILFTFSIEPRES